MGVEVSLVLTKCDLISEKKRTFLFDKFQKWGYQAIELNLKKLLLEVSQSNVTAERFYSRFDFSTVGIRKNYYKDGSNALLKEKKLTTK